MIFESEEQPFLTRLEPVLKDVFKKDEKIAIKLHMGEDGNKNYIKPDLTKKIVNLLLKLETKPFLFDSPALYPGGRDSPEKYLETAKQHGYTKETIGCPIIISNKANKVKTNSFEPEVCTELEKADGMLVLTHIKGHVCAGFGGAIKNLGMGAVSAKTKKDIHTLPQPELKGKCLNCEACLRACPMGAIIKGKDSIKINYDSCWGCDICVDACKSNVLKPKLASFDRLLAQAAFAVIKNTKKQFYINIIKQVAKYCDCMSNAGPIVSNDIGYLASNNITEIDKKSLDLINEKAGKNLFLKENRKDPYIQVQEMEQLLK